MGTTSSSEPPPTSGGNGVQSSTNYDTTNQYNHARNTNGTDPTMSNETFPEDGIRLSYLTEFIEKECGGRDKIRDMTTQDICEQFIKPRTKEQGISYVEYLKAIDHQNEERRRNQGTTTQSGVAGERLVDQAPITKMVGKAEVFISHAWKYRFIDVIDALHDHFRDKPDIILWFDNFTINQHYTQQKKFNWWSTTFKDAIQNFGHTVMVLAPWRCPIPLTRAWCLWELYCTSTTNTKFEVAMSLKEQDDFFNELVNDPNIPIDRMLSSIDVRNASAYNPKDLENIFEAIAHITGEFTGQDEAMVREGYIDMIEKKEQARLKGCEILNAIVFRRMREWVIEIAERRLATRRFTAGQRLEDKLVLGSIYYNHGRYEKAEPILIECTEYFRRGNYNDDNFYRYIAMNYLGSLHGKKNRHNKSEPMLKMALEKKRQLAKDDNAIHQAHIVKAYYELGKYYEMRRLFPFAWENYNTGLTLAQEALKRFSSTTGQQEFPEEHVLTGMIHIHRLQCLDPPSTTLENLPKFVQEVEDRYIEVRDIVNRIKDIMNHEPTAVAGDSKNERKLSENHQLIVHAFMNKAKAYDLLTRHDLGTTDIAVLSKRLDTAANAYYSSIKRSKELLGNRHPETVKLLRIMSKFFHHAEKVYEQTIQNQEKMLEAQQLSNYYFQDYRSKL